MTTGGTSLLGTLSILAVIPGLSVLYREFLDRAGVRRSAVLTTLIAGGSLLVWLALSLAVPGVASSPLEWPCAALAALGGFLCSLTVRDATAAAIPAILYSLLWTAVVFTPIAVFVLFPVQAGLGVTGGALDLGGALPVHVGVGASALVIILVVRRWSVADHSHVRPRSWLLALSGLVIWAGSIGGWVGLELSMDGVVTPRIILNGVVAPVLAAIAWIIVQRIATASTSAFGIVAGLVSGIIAITPGVPYFTPLWAGVTGAVAGIVACVFVTGRIRVTRRHAWFIVGAHLVSAIIGLLMLGIFSTDFGVIYEGQLGLLVTQFLAIVAASVWSIGISTLLWFFIHRLAARRAVST